MATTKVTTSDLLNFNNTTGAVRLPVGTTAERPGSASNAELRFNTDTSLVEYYDGSNWTEFDNIAAFPLNPIYYMVLAGGGAGGPDDWGGGGGAGGLRTSYGSTSGGGCTAEVPTEFISGQTYTITVGAGGTGNGNSYPTTSGFASSISGTSVNISTTGGGKGGGFSDGGVPNRWYGQAGGSGGGGSSTTTYGAGPAVDCEGYDGAVGGGGGGAAGVGTAISGNVYSGAGPALSVSITGSSANYGAGGDGSYSNMPYIVTAPSGAANSGGGGTGSGRSNNKSGNGGSGIVILRMPTSQYSGTTTGSPTVTTDGSDTILVYNGSGTYTH